MVRWREDVPYWVKYYLQLGKQPFKRAVVREEPKKMMLLALDWVEDSGQVDEYWIAACRADVWDRQDRSIIGICDNPWKVVISQLGGLG